VDESELIKSVVHYWLTKADQALDSASAEADAGRFSFSVNRSYYACFYAASAVLLEFGKRFSKHSGVRGALHKELVNTGKLPQEIGRIYDRLFERRQEADYVELVEFTHDDAVRYVTMARQVVAALGRLISDTVR